MLGRKPIKKSPHGAKGQGAAAAKQLGLFVDFDPDEMMKDMDDDGDDDDLEAELAALTGKKKTGEKPKPKGKTPLPMEHIAKMAEDCMRDIDVEDDDDDEDMEEDEDLLAELQEVVGESEDEEEETMIEEEQSTSEAGNRKVETTERPVAVEQLLNSPVTPQLPEAQDTMSPAVSELQQLLQDRIGNYKTAIVNAKEAGDTSKERRYDRGLKTLQTMLSGVKKGKKINEEEIPPPVASGKNTARVLPQPTESESESGETKTEETLPSKDDTNNSRCPEPPLSINTSQKNDMVAPAAEKASESADTRALLVARQREYKLAALKAKQQGNIEKAKEYMKIGKKFDIVIEALDRGQPVDLSNMPPAPEAPEAVENALFIKPECHSEGNSQKTATPMSQGHDVAGVPQQPSTVLEALQQRMEKYKSAAEQAKASGDDRKARMHERIAKQYQDAIRAQKAGRKVNLEELPIPPGFPPIPGMENTGGNSTVAGVLEAASKLASAEVKEDDDDDDDDGDETGTAVLPPVAKKQAKLPEKPTQVVKPLIVPPAADLGQITPEQTKKVISPSSPRKSSSAEQLSPTAREQLEFLENRKKQYLKAAVQAKQKNDLEQAKLYLKTAKSFDPNIELAKSGKSVDISKLPSPPTDDESGFIFIHHNDVSISQKSEEVYAQLLKLLKEQHEKCMQYARQFTHMGNVTETTRFEKLAQNCKKNVEILHLAQAQGLDPPPHHFEEKTFKIVRIFAELSSTEMLLIIVKGINLPAPSGVTPNDLDAFVKFEFHYPSAEQAQKNKTTVIKNTNCPEYDQNFKLNINRNHRGFKRVIQAKGIKFEIFHKGSFFFRSDKLVGTAQLKLDKLESECEIREIIEIFDGRKPTGGKLEVKVRLREPLSGQDLQTITESWLVLEQNTCKVGNS